MNTVGKIFTVLILVMSLVFMSFAVAVYATHKNWKKVVDNPSATPEHPLGLKQQLTEEEQRNERLKDERDHLNKELKTQEASKRKALTRLETEKSLLNEANITLQKKEAQLEKERRQGVALTEAAEKRLLVLTNQVDTLRTDIREAEKDRNDHFKEVVRLTDELHQAVAERERLKERNRQVAGDLAKAMQVLRLYGLKAEPSIYTQAPKLDSVVTAISSEGQVEILLGSDDGLLTGHQLYVYRIAAGPPNYVAKIEVVKTTADKAACKIDPKTQRSAVQVGDRVKTRLREPKQIPPG